MNEDVTNAILLRNTVDTSESFCVESESLSLFFSFSLRKAKGFTELKDLLQSVPKSDEVLEAFPYNC